MGDAESHIRTHRVTVRVRYAETDQMGVVYHGNYLVWMEIGRVEYVRSLGMNYKDLEQDGLYLAVVGVTCRYLRPAKYDQEIAIDTRLLNANARAVEFGYEMRITGDDQLIAQGSSKHMWLSRDWKPTRLPREHQRMLYAGANQDVNIKL